MRIKLFQIDKWYCRFDLTILDRYNTLLGFNYCEGSYIACKNETKEECMEFEYAEQQIGFLLFTIAIGKELKVWEIK